VVVGACHPSNIGNPKIRGSLSRLAWGGKKKPRLCHQNNQKKKGLEVLTQSVEHVPNMNETLSSNPVLQQQQQQKVE
jgi:hypothetical protein